MNDIFLSTVTDVLFIALFRDSVLLESICEENSLLHSENFVSKIEQLLRRAQLRLADIDTIFFLSGPGSQTGERVAFSFVTAVRFLKPEIQLLTIDSLSFQLGAAQDCLSVVTIGKNAKKYFVNCYQGGVLTLAANRIGSEEFTKIVEKFAQLDLLINYEKVDFLNSFRYTKDKFRIFEGVN